MFYFNPPFEKEGLFYAPFYSDPQEREKISIVNLLSSPLFWQLGGMNPIVKWVAVDVPMEKFSKNKIEGDIDILVSLTFIMFDKNKIKTKWDIVRTFEVKVFTLNNIGELKSTKMSKKEKIIGQLKKQLSFGCENIFLLDYCVVQPNDIEANLRGFTEAQSLFRERFKILSPTPFGYFGFLNQPASSKSGKILKNKIKYSSVFKKKSPFIKMLAELDSFKSKSGIGMPIILYCRKCKNRIAIEKKKLSFYRCSICNPPYSPP